MKIKEITELLDAKVIVGEDKLDSDLETAFCSDMMSDVLAFVKNQCLLITGLCNPQVIRTAEMMDIPCVCFVRGKQPDEMAVKLAESKGITLITSPKKMFTCCGILYTHGIGVSE